MSKCPSKCPKTRDWLCRYTRDELASRVSACLAELDEQDKRIEELQAENKRYKEALEKISIMHQGMMFYDASQFPESIANLALKESEK